MEKVYNKIKTRNIRTHYIYAPRYLNLICNLTYEKNGSFTKEHVAIIANYYKNKINKSKQLSTFEEQLDFIKENFDKIYALSKMKTDNYRKYLYKKNLIGKQIAMVDSVSLFYSAQEFIEKILGHRIDGFYYLIQKGAKERDNVFIFKKKSHYTDDLSLIEFFMTSPEAPIIDIIDGQPIYQESSSNEKKRSACCTKMSSGAIEFAIDIEKIFGDIPIDFDIDTLTKWLYSLIKNPTDIDKYYFNDILFAYDPNHKNFTRLFPQWYDDRNDITKRTISIFGIKVLTKKTKKNISRYKLFNIIPILRIKNY